MDINGVNYSFTQASCDECFYNQHPERYPVRIIDPDVEVCCFCGTVTRSGIYIRVDPSTVEYPTPEEGG